VVAPTFPAPTTVILFSIRVVVLSWISIMKDIAGLRLA
jgi:hypothetical protein